jgi:hypothetical protein
VDILYRTENIQSKFQSFPCASQHVSVDCCDDIPDPCLILNITHRKKSSGVMSGDRGGQASGPSLPSQRFGNVASRQSRTILPQCSEAPSCWKITVGWRTSTWGTTNYWLFASWEALAGMRGDGWRHAVRQRKRYTPQSKILCYYPFWKNDLPHNSFILQTSIFSSCMSSRWTIKHPLLLPTLPKSVGLSSPTSPVQRVA